MEGEQKTAHKLSNGTSLNDLQWPITHISMSRLFNVKFENCTTNSYTYNGRLIESRIWAIERRYFQWLWTTPTFGIKVTPLFDAEYLRNGTR